MGFVSAMGRFGGLISPFVLELGKIHSMIPTLIVSIVCYVTAYTTIKLPETNKKPLLQACSHKNQLPEALLLSIQSILFITCIIA